ncbi:MAG TPA: hypothetical protein VG267_18540 [Terracidiphilus sp.]|jgi:hypothetical protein|nr:hypothetical protein [Terracidiphilus sp.]
MTAPFQSVFLAALSCAALALAAAPLMGQYPGQVKEKSKDTPELRAVAVLEWTGDAGKPKTSRLVPVTIYDGEQLQDAGVYMARPQPLALDAQVEYQLKADGKTIGFFDIKNAGQEQGSWVGFGDWKGLPKPKPAMKPAKIDEDEDWSADDKPILHRKKHADDKSKSGSPSGGKAPADDPDRPTLHRPSGDSSDSQQSSAGTQPVDPDRPVLKKPEEQKPAKPADSAHADSTPDVSDPDRPRLIRGKPANSGSQVTPTLMGLPPDMQQAVAVSDARNSPDHPWVFTWANPDDQNKMKAQLEDIARQAMGLTPPPPPPARTSTRRSTSKKAAAPAPPPEPAPLEDEQFRVFELAYDTGATMVLTAHTAGTTAQEKFVTVIGQPDLYGNVRVLLKSVTDGSHLDETPRMRLVDAVDAMADNRGELLFELRGETQRQFALYRVLRGAATRLFVSSAGPIATVARE